MSVTRPCSTSVFECPCLFSYFGDNGQSAVWLSILSSGPALRFLRIFTTTCFGQGRALWALILAALLLPVCVRQCYSQTAHGRDHLSDNISGTVLNSVTREPIGRALVYTFDKRSAAFTDEHGHFELIVAMTADMSDTRARAQIHERLQAKKPGFVTEQGRYGSIDVAPDQDDAILSLVPEALIVGHVKFPSAEAADHVQVQLYRREARNGFGQWAPQTSITTLADGEFRFADLEAGEYKVFTLETTEQDPLANVPNGPVFGFPPRFFSAARDFATADTIQLKAGETVTANIAPDRQRYFDVRIPVIKPQVGPGAGLSVSVHAQGHRGPGFELGYDPDQNAIRGSLPNGSYIIEASSNDPDSATGTTAITVANGPVNGPPLALTPNVFDRVQRPPGLQCRRELPNIVAIGVGEPAAGGGVFGSRRWRSTLFDAEQSSGAFGRKARTVLGAGESVIVGYLCCVGVVGWQRPACLPAGGSVRSQRPSHRNHPWSRLRRD